MGPQEKKEISVLAENQSGLVGSSYGAFVIASGLRAGQRYSQFNSFTVRLIPETENQSVVFALFGGLLLFIIGGCVWLLKERRARLAG